MPECLIGREGWSKQVWGGVMGEEASKEATDLFRCVDNKSWTRVLAEEAEGTRQMEDIVKREETELVSGCEGKEESSSEMAWWSWTGDLRRRAALVY